MKCWPYLLQYSTHIWPPNKALSQACPLSNPCIGYPLVWLSARLWKIKSPGHTWGQYCYTFYLQGTTWWSDQIPDKRQQKKSPQIFRPICSILTILLYRYPSIWKECIINKNFDCTIYPIWPPNCIRAFGFLSWPSFHESSPPGAAMQAPGNMVLQAVLTHSATIYPNQWHPHNQDCLKWTPSAPQKTHIYRDPICHGEIEGQ